MSFRKALPNRFKVSDTPIPYSESVGGEIKEEYGIMDIILGDFYPQSQLQQLCDLLNDMEKDYKLQQIQIETYVKLHEIAKLLQKVEL